MQNFRHFDREGTRKASSSVMSFTSIFNDAEIFTIFALVSFFSFSRHVLILSAKFLVYDDQKEENYSSRSVFKWPY